MNSRLRCIRILLLLSALILGSFCDGRYTQISKLGFNSHELTRIDPSPARRSLLSNSNEVYDTALVATLDGAINLVDLKSAENIWSFGSGKPIYSSYQANFKDDEDFAANGPDWFIDCGDDWRLYQHSAQGINKIDMTVEDYVRASPHIFFDETVVLGSRKSTVFLISASTGKLIHTYSLVNKESTISDQASIGDSKNPNPSSTHLNGEVPLYITRTDYVLEAYEPISGRVLWNVSVSDFSAAFLRQNTEKSLDGDKFRLKSYQGLPYVSSYPSHMPVFVERLRNNIMPHMLPGKRENLMLPTFASEETKLESESHTPLVKNYGVSGGKDVKLPDVKSVKSPQKIRFSVVHHKWSLILFVLVVLSLLYYGFATGNSTDSQPIYSGTKLKRKKNRKQKNLENGYSSNDNTVLTPFLNLNQYDDGENVDMHRIGKLLVSNKELAKGSNGTIVLEGMYEGRPVAVKRLVRAHHDVAFKEIQNLIASDRHANIVRWYGVEYDQHFVYIALERCACSLADMVQMYSGSCEKASFPDSKAMVEYRARLDSMKGVVQDIALWKSYGNPSPVLLKLMKDLVSGLVHLHELGIVHRDLKPQNVLIIKERGFYQAKLSDMGISKRLVGDMSSLGHHATGCGSSGWQAPEQLLHGRQTRSVDIFSLGCVLFYCITGGRHPFGQPLERDINITKNQVDLFALEYFPEAVDLISRLLHPLAELRPKAIEVLHHPFFWRSQTRLSFLHDTSDRVELEDRETGSGILSALESVAIIALDGKWDKKLEPSFLNNIGRYRRYNFESVRDLLRVIRNKLNHYRELPFEIQGLLGSVPEGFDSYFASRFPKLLVQVYNVMQIHCKDEEWFRKYINSDAI